MPKGKDVLTGVVVFGAVYYALTNHVFAGIVESVRTSEVGSTAQKVIQKTGQTAVNSTVGTRGGLTLDDVINAGKPLDTTTPAGWKNLSKDSRLDWNKAIAFKLPPGTLTPQGIGGTGTAGNYLLGGKPAPSRNILTVTSNGSGKTMLTVMDLDKKLYNHVRLMKGSGSLVSHGSGMAMAGDYLYTSSHSKLWQYRADGFIEKNGEFQLPTVDDWTVGGTGGLSSLYADTSRPNKPAQLVGVNYSRHGGSYVQRIDLNPDGSLATNSSGGSGMVLKGKNTVESTDKLALPGDHYQGAGSYTTPDGSTQYTFGHTSGHDLTIMKNGSKVDTVKTPHSGVGESVYVNTASTAYATSRRDFCSINEHPPTYLFCLPMDEILKHA